MMFTIQILQAQTILPIPLNIKIAFEKGTRSVDGKPGKNYWQNDAVYNNDVSFDPATRLIKGVTKINGTTMVASLSTINLGVVISNFPQVIFSFGTAPE